MINRNRLKELVDYDQDTGIFTWKVSRPNGIYPGMIAGQTDMHYGFFNRKEGVNGTTTY